MNNDQNQPQQPPQPPVGNPYIQPQVAVPQPPVQPTMPTEPTAPGPFQPVINPSVTAPQPTRKARPTVLIAVLVGVVVLAIGLCAFVFIAMK